MSNHAYPVAQRHTAQLLDILEDREFITICETIISNLDAHLSPSNSIELIFAYRGPGHAILQHALRGHLSFVKNCVAVERIAAELRPHGPQWMVNVIAKAVLPPEDATATLRRLAPEPVNALWKALCKGKLHHFNIENAIWAIIAKTMGYVQFTRIPDSDQYTSLDRLRRTECALSAIIVKLGYRENGTELCLATLIATCIAYHDDCTALNEPTRKQFMRSVILPRASRARGPSSTNGAQTPRSPSTSSRPTRSRSSVSSVPDATARSCRTSRRPSVSSLEKRRPDT